MSSMKLWISKSNYFIYGITLGCLSLLIKGHSVSFLTKVLSLSLFTDVLVLHTFALLHRIDVSCVPTMMLFFPFFGSCNTLVKENCD